MSRTRETEADYIGMWLLSSCGYYPQAAIESVQRRQKDNIQRLAQLKATLPPDKFRMKVLEMNESCTHPTVTPSLSPFYNILFTNSGAGND